MITNEEHFDARMRERILDAWADIDANQSTLSSDGVKLLRLLTDLYVPGFLAARSQMVRTTSVGVA